MITASGGNHGVAVSHVASRLGIRAEVFVTETTPEAKIARIKANGAASVIVGRYYDDAQSAMHARAEEPLPSSCIRSTSPRRWPGKAPSGGSRALGGQLDSVLVAVGGGGLIAGVSGWYEGRARVISVEPENPGDVTRAGRRCPRRGRGRRHRCRLARHQGGREPRVPIAQKFVANAVLVSDEAILRAQRALWDRVRVPPSPAGRLRWLRCSRVFIRSKPGERIGVLVCGAAPTPRRCSPHRSRANNRPSLAGKSHRIALTARFRVRGTSTPTDTTVARCRPRV